jgi:dTDP-4-dehydrorhamnose reductase
MIYSHDIIKKRILVTGSNGMLGQRIIHFFSNLENVELLACSVEDKQVPGSRAVEYLQTDLRKRESIKGVVLNFYPDFIINAAAFTNVDLCESDKENAWKLNVKGVEYLAEACRALDAHLVHISSDYIFDGKRGPYSENSKPNPLGYYGRTKLASENALKISGAINTIIRTNVLFGVANSRPDFVRWVINSLREKKQINIVTDQINNPTYIDDLVSAISKIIEFRRQGIFNIGGRDLLSRYDFAIKIAKYFNLDESLINPIKTEDLKQAALRPLNSGLITIKAESQFGFKPHSIDETLGIMKRELSL